MCDECALTDLDCIDVVLKKARPEQLRRLLRDIRNGRPSNGKEGA